MITEPFIGLIGLAVPYDANEIRAARRSCSYSGRAKIGAKAKRWKEGGGGGEPFIPLPHPLPSTFLLSPNFRAARMRKTSSRGLISFVSNGNACYAGFDRTESRFPTATTCLGSISATLSCKERGLLSRAAADNRAYNLLAHFDLALNQAGAPFCRT